MESRGEAVRSSVSQRILICMAKVETKEVPAERAEADRFDDLWAISDTEIAAGMETLDLDALTEEVARRRGR